PAGDAQRTGRSRDHPPGTGGGEAVDDEDVTAFPASPDGTAGPARTAHNARDRVWLPRRARVRAGVVGTARPGADRGPRAPPPRRRAPHPPRAPAAGAGPAGRARPTGPDSGRGRRGPSRSAPVR